MMMMDFPLPELGEGVYEAELTAWLVKSGDPVKRGQSLMEVLTDKATMEVPSPFIGIVGDLRAEPGEQVKVGQVVLTYNEAGAESNGGTSSASVVHQDPVEAKVSQETVPASRPMLGAAAASVKAAPSVRLMARKLGIDLAQLHGTGPGGRVLIGDLTAHVPAQGSPPAQRPGPKPDHGRPGDRIKLVGVRRKVAEHMVRAKQTVPHYSYIDECDATDLVILRDALKEPLARKGAKLTYLAFFVKAVVHALKEVPIVNSTLDESAGEIVLHDQYHIGVAVAAPAGLIVPVVHDADRKDVAEIARDIERMSGEARAGRPKREDLQGGTFTITSVGNIGGLISTPVINHPEAGIMGVGKIIKRPVYDQHGQIKPADLLYLSFSFDHRIVDGAVGAAFGNEVIHQLQKPAAMLV